MQKVAWLVVALLVLGVVGPLWAAGCHDGNGSGCPMSGCPGSGQTMTDVDGPLTYIAGTHDVVKVKVGGKELKLYVHPDCPNKDQLTKQIGQLKVGQTLKGTYYTKDGKLYLCQIGSAGSCH